MVRPTQEQVKHALALAKLLESTGRALQQAAVKYLVDDPKALNDVSAVARTINQQARDLEYEVSQQLAKDIASSDDIKNIVARTQELTTQIKTITDARAIVSIASKAESVLGAVIAAILDPTHAGIPHVVKSIIDSIKPNQQLNFTTGSV